jgi:pyruvate,water dikinase
VDLVVALDSPHAADPGRFGPKAANLAALGAAGLPVPGGYAVGARAYRLQLATLGLEATAREVFASPDPARARRCALDMRLALMEKPVAPQVAEPMLSAWRACGKGVVRSSALVEDRAASSFAGQFESFLELHGEDEFLTAARACWAALWSTRALRYMATHGLDPADTAMALIVQPLVEARVSGGGLSRTADGCMVVTAAPGLGSAIAQGEVAPDRYVLDGEGKVRTSAPGRSYHGVACAHGRKSFSRSLSGSRCLDAEQVAEIGLLMRRSEEIVGGPVEIEWAADGTGIKLLQARPLRVAEASVPDEIWLQHPKLDGQPSGIGWAEGRARVVSCECELEQLAPGEVLVTTVAGPALSPVLARVAGVVAELGGSTSHLASLARERGVPMVLGVPGATQRIPNGAMVAVDGVAGVVRWMQ